jgi:hypothetical protein
MKGMKMREVEGYMMDVCLEVLGNRKGELG